MQILVEYSYSFLRDGVGGVDVFGAFVEGGGEAELVHHPVGFGAFSGAAAVVNQRLLQPYAFPVRRVDRPVYAGRFPKTGPRHSIRPDAVLVFSPSSTEKVPLLLTRATL